MKLTSAAKRLCIAVVVLLTACGGAESDGKTISWECKVIADGTCTIRSVSGNGTAAIDVKGNSIGESLGNYPKTWLACEAYNSRGQRIGSDSKTWRTASGIYRINDKVTLNLNPNDRISKVECEFYSYPTS